MWQTGHAAERIIGRRREADAALSAEVAIRRRLFATVPERIRRLRSLRPVPG